jgi:hypothetical protein
MYVKNFTILFKLKIFLWLVLSNSILRKDSLLKRGWLGKNQLLFCGVGNYWKIAFPEIQDYPDA